MQVIEKAYQQYSRHGLIKTHYVHTTSTTTSTSTITTATITNTTTTTTEAKGIKVKLSGIVEGMLNYIDKKKPMSM